VSKQTFDEIKKLAILKNANTTSERLNLYAKILDSYDLELVKKAIVKIALESKFFPDISEIVAILDPKMDEKAEANEMAGAIIESISRYGRYHGEGAAAYLGKKAWLVVSRLGGWSDLCKVTNSELNTLRAQIRDLSQAMNQLSKTNPENEKIPYKKEGLQQLNFDGLKLLGEK